ncbi:T-cell receptor gamma alternate reading frame protein [Pteropus medius]|uniref:TCR gamma alternate reading frame protein n=1 Tax=Pteropus vampyrus TaxID=132908 RepID=UPI00196A3760|nr:TCR gamma alternate reading frame protein [Pteropus giganteus]
MSLLEAFAFMSFWPLVLGLSKVEQSQISISTVVKKSVDIHCKISSTSFEKDVIFWYWQKPNQALEYLIRVSSTQSPARSPKGGKSNKVEARKNSQILTSILTINFIEKEDAAIYYCAGWSHSSGWIKIFAEGTKLIVTPPDRRLNSDISPKPTIFLPSIAEINLHKAGTYLCLLEKFFPDVIKVSWKEKDSNTILESQQGDTIKINDTYMKFSWLTVTAKSMNKDHKCIVKHENNKRGVDQEILFPSIMNKEHKYKAKYENNKRGVDQEILSSSIKEEVAAINNAKEACLKDESDMLQLQFTNTSAYYTYLLLLLKSMIYFAIIAFCLFRRTAVCGNGKSS